MIRSIAVEALQVGMYIEGYGDGCERLPGGLVMLQNEGHVQQVRSLGVASVCVNFSRSTHGGVGVVRTRSFEEEFPVAERAYSRAVEHARVVLERIRAGRGVRRNEADEVAEGLCDSVRRNECSLIAMARLRKSSNRLSAHMVNVAVLCASYGAYLGLNPTDIHLLALAGLLHDVGMAKLPQDLVERRGAMNDEDRRLLLTHPLEGYLLLRGSGDMSDEVVASALDHHEHENGSGYPRKLAGSDIDPFARVVAVANAYDEMVSGLESRTPRTPYEAVRTLYSRRQERHSAEEVEGFIKSLGVYPAGTLVRLSDGTCGVVCETRVDKPLHPSVRVLFDARMRQLKPYVLDLATQMDEEEVSVAEAIDTTRERIDVSLFFH